MDGFRESVVKPALPAQDSAEPRRAARAQAAITQNASGTAQNDTALEILARNPRGLADQPSAAGHRERLRQRFLQAGLAALSEHEILELLLTFAIPRRDTKPLAKRLIARFGTLHNALAAKSAALEDEKGCGPAVAALLNLVRDIAALPLPGPRASAKLRNPADVRAYLVRQLGARPEEHFHIFMLDQQNRVIASEEVERGIENRAHIYIKKIVHACLDRHATGIILAHNHPSGTPAFSAADIDLTRRIQQALEPLEIRLLDHMLVCREVVLSMVEEGVAPLGG